MKDTEQYLSVVLFIMLHKLFLTRTTTRINKNECVPTYCFTGAAIRLHVVPISAKTFKASFRVETNLTTHSRCLAFIYICKDTVYRVLKSRKKSGFHNIKQVAFMGYLKARQGITVALEFRMMDLQKRTGIPWHILGYSLSTSYPRRHEQT